MRTFTVITNLDHRPVAIIGDCDLIGHQFDPLYAILPDSATRSHDDLASLWEVPFVLATEDWAKEQRKRFPMTRPKGHKLALIS